MEYYEKYNGIVEKYINQKKLRSAIMLTAPWGSGKSYYIENNLMPYLRKKGIDIISISLYGIPTIDELNNILVLAYISKIKESVLNTKKYSAFNWVKAWFSKHIENNKVNAIKNIVVDKVGMLLYGMAKTFNVQMSNKDIFSLKEFYQGDSEKKY